jgi:two-component system, NarL family, response regulator YdfI
VIRVVVIGSSLDGLLDDAPSIEVLAVFASWSELHGLDADVVLAEWDGDVQSDTLDTPIVLVAVDVLDALRSGARTVLSRRSSSRQIVAALHAAASGLVAMEVGSLESLLPAPRIALRPAEQLTPREVEVLRLLADGDSNKIVAYRLGISEHTVKFHVTSIMAKLGAGSRTEAVTLGIRQGLILI